jgi:hypothetical protein
MITASEKLATMLSFKERDPEKYKSLIKAYNIMYGRSWERSILLYIMRDQSQ